MNPLLESIGRSLSTKPAPSTRVRQVGCWELPEDYVEFIHQFNAAEGPIGGSQYIALWPVNELEKLNQGYSVPEFWPKVVLFGSDGGGMAYGFSFIRGGLSVSAVPFDSIDERDVRDVADSFTTFMINLDKIAG